MPTPNMNLTLPTIDGSSGTWDTQLNDLINLVDAHTHEAGNGVTVKSAGISINANLTFAGWIPTNVGAVAFAERISAATPAIPNQSLWVSSVDDELYWRRAGGTDVKVTSGAALNVSIVGGITGDYAASGASFYYDDANKRYKALRSVSPDFWAAVAAGEFELLEKASGISNKVTLKSPAALAASYTVTFPAAAPGTASLVQMSAVGTLTASNTVANPVALSSTLSVAGVLTATAGVTAAANQHVTVSAAGDFKHGDKVLNLAALDGNVESGWAPVGGGGYMTSSGAGNFIVGIPLKQGDRVTSVTFSRFGNALANFNEVTAFKMSATGTLESIGTISVLAPAAAWADTTIALTATTIAAGEALYIVFVAGATGLRVGTVRVTYDRP